MELQDMEPKLIKNENSYNFWELQSPEGKTYWNITPDTEKTPPLSGYANREYIEAIKHQKF